MTEVLIWIAGSTLLFIIALMAGRFLFHRSAAKRRCLFSASLGFTIAIPLFAIGIHSLTQMNIPLINNTLQKVSSLVTAPKEAEPATIAVDLGAPFSEPQRNFANEGPATFTPVPTISSVNEVLLQPIIPQAKPPEPTQSLLATWQPTFFRALLATWLLGGCLSLIRLLRSYRKSHLYLREAELISNGTIFELLQSVGTQVGLKKLPQVYAVPENVSPAVISPFQPKVIFSETALEQLNNHELRAILTHELSHIKRYDLPLNFVLQVVLAFHWFNPLAHRVFGQFRLCQEELCDNEVAQSNDQFSYARLLIKVNQMFSGTENRCALAASSCEKVVGRRVDRLLDEDRDSQLKASWIWRTGSTTVTLLICLAVSITTAAVQLQPLTELATSSDEDSLTNGLNHALNADEDLEKETFLLLTKWHIDGNMGKLSWKHIPYLLKHIEDDGQIGRIPASPFSSQSQDDCTVGTAAMWFIDMICCKRYPALNPIFHVPGSDKAPPHADAVQSFQTWWELVKDWPESEARRVNPLTFTNLIWEGGRDISPYAHSPVQALNNYFHHGKIVSVSPNGKLVFMANCTDDKPAPGILSKITKEGLVQQWQIEDFEVKPVFTLNSGLLLKTFDFHDKNQSPPHLEFVKEGQVIESVDLAKIAIPDVEQTTFELDLQLDKEQLRINVKFKKIKTLQQNAFLFDQKTGNLLETRFFESGSDKPTKITAELHSDEQIQELATFDIDQISNTGSILRAPTLDVVPAGETLTRAEVFEALNLNENLVNRFRHEQQNRVIFLTWQVSPSYDISLMTGVRDPKNANLELTDSKRRVYGVRLLPTKKQP